MEHRKKLFICLFFLFPYILSILNFHCIKKFIDATKARKSVSEESSCTVPTWNQVSTDTVPFADNFREWAAVRLGALTNMVDAEARLLSAFLYIDQISIITTSQHIDNNNVTCVYYDCMRKEMPNTRFDTIVAPMTVVSCPRRIGVEYVSIKFNNTEEPHEPIPLINRIIEKPEHELAVCVGPLYGNESKWLQIIEYVEHYKLLGASYFYFTLFNLNEYDRKIVDYYSKFGFAEYTTYISEYKRLGWMFHLIQVQECHHRSRFHSKWIFNVDIDERVVYTGSKNFLSYLRLIPSNVGEISFSTNRVLKTGKNPDRFVTMDEIDSELMFLKYKNTTELSWFNLKGAVRPDIVFVLFYHWSYRQIEGVHVMSVPKRVAHIRHYRNVDKDGLNGDWLKNYDGNLKETLLERKFEKRLIESVKKRIKYVYDQRSIRCEEIPKTFFIRFARKIIDCEYKKKTINA